MAIVTSKQKRHNQARLISVGFYAFTGVLLLVFLPFTGVPPHVGFLGIVSLIAAYSLYMKRAWAGWLVVVLLFAITAFTVVTIFSVALSNVLVTAILTPYLVFAWLISIELYRSRIH